VVEARSIIVGDVLEAGTMGTGDGRAQYLSPWLKVIKFRMLK